MKDGEIDYSSFADHELQEALATIDERKVPLNYARLKQELGIRAKRPPPPVVPEEPPKPYVPNHIQPDDRLECLLLSLLLVSYGAVGLLLDDLYFPRKYGGVHFHGDAALYAYIAMVLSTGGLLSVVVDHYDERNNEELYLGVASLAYVGAFAFYIAALLGNAS